ncbi:MAG: hypothetical protein JHC93_01075 [Parachlamydiales bacterium]|nr:hypothetical protein [Parachlamydiales bacterium]
MSTQPVTTKVCNLIAIAAFILGVAMFSYMAVGQWGPGLFMVTGIALTVRQLLMGKMLDVLVCVIVFGAGFFCSFFNLLSRIFIPTLLVVGAVYLGIRQFFEFGQNKKSEAKQAKKEAENLLKEARAVHKQNEQQHKQF